MTPRVAVDLSRDALLRAHVTGVLAADLTLAEGGRWTLATRAEDLSPDTNTTPPDSKGAVQVVTVRGPIDQRATAQLCGGFTDGYDAIEARFGAAVQKASEHKGGRVVLAIDSPGGMVAGMLPAVRRMRRVAESAGVRVIAVADEQATSAAYALALVGDEVHVPPHGRTASVGSVIVRHQATDAAGAEVFRSGDRKARPNAVEALDAKDRAELQALVDTAAADFAAWVAERRGMAAEDVLALEGAALSGADAARRGLTDGTFTAHEVITMAQEQAALDAVREALALPATATAEMMVTKAREGREALSALSEAKAAQAKAEAARIALEEQTAREKAQTEATQKRAAFAAEVKAACDAATITPPTEAKLLAHYDAHGEASARATFDVVRSAGPIVRTSQPGGKDVPSDVAVAVTPSIAARAKQLGVDPQEYAAALAAEVK